MRADRPADGRDLRDEASIAARIDALASPHMVPIERYRRELETRRGATPHADARDGGVLAELLILLETPGPRGPSPRIVSCDNPTGTARHLRRALDKAGIDRHRIVIWNVVPWLIHEPGARNRPPRRREIAAGMAELPGFQALLPRLRAVVAAGRIAAGAAPVLAAARPGLPVLSMPHPSPTYVCTSPDVALRIQATLDAAAALLGEDGTGEARRRTG